MAAGVAGTSTAWRARLRLSAGGEAAARRRLSRRTYGRLPGAGAAAGWIGAVRTPSQARSRVVVSAASRAPSRALAPCRVPASRARSRAPFRALAPCRVPASSRARSRTPFRVLPPCRALASCRVLAPCLPSARTPSEAGGRGPCGCGRGLAVRRTSVQATTCTAPRRTVPVALPAVLRASRPFPALPWQYAFGFDTSGG
jgi:hypothetical protein